MQIDAQNSFCTVANNVMTPQAETTADSYDSDNVIDLTHSGLRFVKPVYFIFQCAVVPVSAGGGTLTISLVNSAAAALSTPTTIWSSGIIANATIVAWTANSTIYVVPVMGPFLLRYLGVDYTIATAALSAGSWRAFLSTDYPAIIPDAF